MTYSFDIDVGGTFTDCFITKGNEAKVAKTPTTYYDLSVCFMNAIEEGAKLFGDTLEEALQNTSTIRYSTTIGTNALIEQKGPKIGVIATAGFEDTIYIGRSRQWADGQIAQENRDVGRIQKPNPLIDREMVVGINERIDSFGNVVVPIQREEILEKVQFLVDKGATGIVVGFLWSFLNSKHEEMVKSIIEEEYPDAYLGHIPVLLSSEISPKSGEYGRIMTAIVNLYIHEQLVDQVGDISAKLRDLGYDKPLILVHNTGGMKKATRTKSISTHNAGPVSGVYGSTYIGEIYDTNNIIFTDMGGTSFDIGIVADGKVPYVDDDFVIDRWRTQINAVQTKSIGAGGGSIAWLNEAFGNLLEVGPMSARAFPGPAAYDLGGEEPTVTDADIVLGYINPDYYLGGEMVLNYEKAFVAIKEKIADPLGISVVDAAARIRRLIDAHMGHEIYKEVALKGHDPSEFVIFAGGGAGPVHCCGFNEFIEAKKIITCPFSSVFGAFGSSTLNIMHLYEQSSYMKLTGSGSLPEKELIAKFNNVIVALKEEAIRDFLLEGYRAEDIRYSLSLEMKYGSQVNTTKIISPVVELNDNDDLKMLSQAFTDAYSERYSSEAAFPEGGIVIDTFILKAEITSANYSFKKMEETEQALSRGIKETREIYSFVDEKMVPALVFDFEKLSPGTVIQGPAVIESSITNYVVETNYCLIFDEYGNGIFKRVAGESTFEKVLKEENV